MNLSDFEKHGVTYTWKTIYVGIENNFFDLNVVSGYAVKLLEEGKNDSINVDLAWNINKNKFKETVEKIKYNLYPDLLATDLDYLYEMRKFRYIYLSKLRKNISDEKELMYKIEEYYSWNNYPEDMESLIYYMPIDVKQNYFIKGDTIPEKLDNFLDKERIELVI